MVALIMIALRCAIRTLALLARARTLALAAFLLPAVGMQAAWAAPDYLDGAIAQSYAIQCGTGNLFPSYTAQVGYQGDPTNNKPATYDVYYVRVVVANVTTPCVDNNTITVNLYLPSDTALAIDPTANQTVKCLVQFSTGGPQQNAAECPAQLSPSPDRSIPILQNTGKADWYTPFPRTWEFQIPVRSTKAFSGGLLWAKVIANGDTIVAQQVVTVFPRVPSISYPSPSTNPNGPAPAVCIDDTVHCHTDAQCTTADPVCFCAPTIQSIAVLNGTGDAGALFFDLGDALGKYQLSTDKAENPQAGQQIWSNWAPYPLGAGKTYHWRARFHDAVTGTDVATGVDQSFKAPAAPWTNVHFCGPAALASLSFALNETIGFADPPPYTPDETAPAAADEGQPITLKMGGQDQIVETPRHPDTTKSEALLSFNLPAGRSVEVSFDFWWEHLLGPSNMRIDLGFVLDRVAQPCSRYDTATTIRHSQRFDNLPGGMHKLKVQARGVLVNGPPEPVRICGTDCYFSNATNIATLAATLLPR